MEKKVLIIIIIILALLVLVLLAARVTGYGIFSVKGRCTSNGYECGDCIDNDGDSLIDYKANRRGVVTGDPDCISATDICERVASIEVCDNRDNDCDGVIDEGLITQCGVSNIGECRYGTSTCSAGGWGVCLGNINPINESCDGKDNDCDSVIDEGCNCINGQNKSCGTDIGECVTGKQTCFSGGWGACVGEIVPTIEICDNKDNDCDNSIDENLICCDSNESCTNPVNTSECRESDVTAEFPTGINIYVKGTATHRSGDNTTVTTTDVCYSVSSVRENFCCYMGDYLGSCVGYFDCPQGSGCVDGACIDETNCGESCQSLGYTCGTQLICGNPNHYCGGCDSGKMCLNGACIYRPTCNDSDVNPTYPDGKNPRIKGTINWYTAEEGEHKTWSDLCNGLTQVIEGYCCESEDCLAYIYCPTGTRCSNGACM